MKYSSTFYDQDALSSTSSHIKSWIITQIQKIHNVRGDVRRTTLTLQDKNRIGIGLFHNLRMK